MFWIFLEQKVRPNCLFQVVLLVDFYKDESLLARRITSRASVISDCIVMRSEMMVFTFFIYSSLLTFSYSQSRHSELESRLSLLSQSDRLWARRVIQKAWLQLELSTLRAHSNVRAAIVARRAGLALSVFLNTKDGGGKRLRGKVSRI